MNKLIPVIVLSVLLVTNRTVSATSGACSYHGGVNCSAGSGIGGNVICNDGWTDSSVKYIDSCEKEIDPYQIALDHCKSLGLNPADYASYSYFDEYKRLNQECRDDNPIKSVSQDQWVNYNNWISYVASVCPEKSANDAAKGLEIFCDQTANKKNGTSIQALSSDEARVKSIQVFSNPNNQNSLLSGEFNNFTTASKSIAISWVNNNLDSVEGYYYSLSKAETLSDDLSNYAYTKEKEVFFSDLDVGVYHFYLKLKFVDSHVSKVRYISTIRIANADKVMESNISTLKSDNEETSFDSATKTFPDDSQIKTQLTEPEEVMETIKIQKVNFYTKIKNVILSILFRFGIIKETANG